MGKLDEFVLNAKNALKELVTADNTEAVAKVSKVLDDLDTQGKAIETENTSLKDKIVEMVKGNLSSTTPPKDDTSGEKEKSIDEIMLEEESKIINRRK